MSRSTRGDEALVQAAQRGDRDAFRELVVRYQHPIHTLCARWLGDREAAAEQTQEVFLAVWRALDGFRGDARFDTWLRRIAVNRCRNHRLHRRRRAHDRHVSLHPGDADTPALQLVSDGPGADLSARHRAARDLVQTALDALEPDHREVIVLRDLEDLDYEEIACLLGVARGTVKSRLHRARAALATLLEGRIGPEDLS